MSYEVVNEFPHELLLKDNLEACISLYQPTHRHGPENQQDLIRYKNQLQKLEQSLDRKYSTEEIEKRMQPFYELGEDYEFWQHAGEGLAVFASQDQCIVYKIERPVKEFTVVANSFHIKPLIRVFQSADRYHLLGISRRNFALFEGTRYQVNEVTLPAHMDDNAKEALDDKYVERVISDEEAGNSKEMMGNSEGTNQDVIQQVTEKFFRTVDNEVYEHYTKPMQLPVYLVALDEHHTIFQNLSKNPKLRETGIKKDYQSLNMDELRDKAWDMLEPIYIEKTKELVEQFENARAQDRGSDDIAQVARAAAEGRIHRILLDSDKVYPGKIDMETGELHDDNIENPEIDDVLDDIAEIVFKQSGEVVVVPEERMPSNTGVAAIYRY